MVLEVANRALKDDLVPQRGRIVQQVGGIAGSRHFGVPFVLPSHTRSNGGERTAEAEFSGTERLCFYKVTTSSWDQPLVSLFGR